MRGQSAIEYVLILAAVMTVFASVTVFQMIDPASDASDDALRVARARSACDLIAGAINSVYANGEGAVKSVGVYLPTIENFGIIEDPPELRIQVLTSERVENVVGDLEYGFDNFLLNIPSGNYTVIVEWTSEEDEGINGENIADDKIYIYINPVG